MCGIIWDTTSTLSDIDIRHRGLYTHRVRTPGGMLHHARLPIVDLSKNSDQPFVDKEWYFSFVGELLNYKSFDPQSVSDAHTMFTLWKQSMTQYAALWDGFWAIVAYNRVSKTVHVVTDFLAKKPLYIHLPTKSISSEIKPLIPLSCKKFDEYYFSTVRKFGYCMNEHTFLKDIVKIPPRAHWIIKGNQIYKKSWGPPLTASKPDMVIPALRKAVRDRVQADVPISILMSGGLDSTIIFELMKQYTRSFNVYHVDNGEREFLNYLDFPSTVTLREIRVTDDIDNALFINEGPSDLGSMLPQYSLHQAIRKKDPQTYVVLTGDGADELFGGYRRSMEYDSQLSDIYDELVYYHLPRLDKMSMAFTMELRSPFLSKHVIRAALSLKYAVRKNKNGLKMYFDDIIHPSILTRPKVPLKSKQVLYQKDWRDELQVRFRRIMYEHYGCESAE